MDTTVKVETDSRMSPEEVARFGPVIRKLGGRVRHHKHTSTIVFPTGTSAQASTVLRAVEPLLAQVGRQ